MAEEVTPPSNVILRRPMETDLDGVLACLAAYRFHVLAAGPLADPDFPVDALLTVRNRICVIDLAERCFVAEQNRLVVGFCCWDWLDLSARQAKTVLISVRDEARGAGLGRLLQIARQDDMRRAGAREIHTWSDDPKAIRWYCGHFGYEQLGEEPIHHALHRIVAGSRSVWGIHRGHVEFGRLAHLRLRL